MTTNEFLEQCETQNGKLTTQSLKSVRVSIVFSNVVTRTTITTAEHKELNRT